MIPMAMQPELTCLAAMLRAGHNSSTFLTQKLVNFDPAHWLVSTDSSEQHNDMLAGAILEGPKHAIAGTGQRKVELIRQVLSEQRRRSEDERELSCRRRAEGFRKVGALPNTVFEAEFRYVEGGRTDANGSGWGTGEAVNAAASSVMLR